MTRLPRAEGEDAGIALVDLDEGVRVMGHVGAAVAIGDRVTLSFPAQPPQPRFDHMPISVTGDDEH